MDEATQDHDAIITVVNEIKNLKASQDAFHKEVRENFAELKNNYQSTLNDHEKRIQNLETTRVDFREKLTNNNRYMNFIIGLGIIILAMLIYHLTGYHI